MSYRLRLVMALVLAGCGSYAVPPTAPPSSPSEFRRLELPGFSIDVPAGLGVGGGNITDYRAGEIKMQGSGQAFEVIWGVGRVYLGDQLTEMVRARVAAEFPGHRYELRAPQTTIAGPHLASVLEFTVDDREVAWVSIDCGKRAVTLHISGPQLVALRDHILDSFDCHPVAATELALDRSPIGVDEPDLLSDWHQIPNDKGLLLTNDVFALVFQLAPGSDMLTAEFRNSLPGLIKALTGGVWSNTRLEKRWTRDGERIFQHGTIEALGERRPGLFVAWRCGDQSTFGLAVPLIAVSDLDSVVELIMKLRCARPGDPSLHLRQGHM